MVIMDNFESFEDLMGDAEEYDRPTVNTVEELRDWEAEKSDNLRSECDTISVVDDHFTFKAYMKHTNVVMETKAMGSKFSPPRPLIESDYYQEEEEEENA